MKRFAIAGLSILCLSLITTTAAQAESKIEHLQTPVMTMNINAGSLGITPFELVSRAYQGSYQMQGIPGFGSFLHATSSKIITANDLVLAAIEAEQLSSDTQTDASYLYAVNSLLSTGRH